MNRKFWNDVYLKKSPNEVSWFQEVPKKSLELISEINLSPEDSIIDIGGGDSRLVDHLLDHGYRNLTVLDISEAALDKARSRLHMQSDKVKFSATDVTKFDPQESYMLWHERATFHFLTTTQDIERYLDIANRAVAPGGFLIVSTFSKSGPDKCSGLPISQYSDTELKSVFSNYFDNIKCLESTHETPWGTTQDFVFCGFKKRVF
ncbi:MAG: class I SAM-dependent methyltransferase [Pseudobdellovibrionaceae bacterium]